MEARAIVNVIDSLDSNSVTDALSANQGRVLNEQIEELKITNHLTGSFNINNFRSFGIHWFKGDTTLTNQPSGVVNGWLIVLNSQVTCKQIWLRSGTPNVTDHEIYERLCTNDTEWSDWKPLHREDSGWINLPLSSDVTVYDASVKPQYRKINGVVYLRGSVKGITKAGEVIGTLPAGYRPTGMSHNYVQLTSIQSNSANFTRLKIGTDGKIVMEEISKGITATYSADKWFPINTSFPVD